MPSDVHLTITRDYGETAADKSNELLWHMLLAVLSVSALIWLVLGRREAAVVLIAIPVTLALTLFMFYLYGYTLNRITLFALIFSVGILVDDAIVVVENIVRHARMSGEERGGLAAIAIRAVDEVGNPTILATLAVVAAILPMAFVRGLSGPYMRPIPVGASAAMVFSLVVAFVVTPWAAVRLLKPSAHHDHGEEDLLTRLYRRVMGPLIASGRRRAIFLAGVAVLLLAAVALVPLELVKVKMMPFDNKSEFQVMIDMPEGTALETTARVASALASATLDDETVVNVQQYVGVSAPYNFNGLVRHYFLRRAPHLADLQVNLVPKGERSAQSHEVAGRVRERLAPIAKQFGATIQVAEVPPGPPVLQTLVAEVYGPDPARRTAVAAQIKSIFEQTPGVVDTDWYVEAPHAKITLAVDGEKAAAAGLSPAAVAAVVRMAGSGESAGLLHDERAREDVPIVIRLPRDDRSLEAVQSIRLRGTRPVAVGELTSAVTTQEGASLYHKNLQAVTYVTGDLAGKNGSPVYAILQMNKPIGRLSLPEGYGLEVFNAVQPFDTSRYAMKWDGEWHLTIEVFRDLGLAFAAVLVLIYVLVVGWFQSFKTPLLIMAAIPFSLVGILPAHAAMGAFFTATSMIGFIAGAGIVVRNSIILVDFIELRLARGASPRAGRRRRRRGAVPPHGPHRRRHDRRRRGHPVRPDFPGPGDLADGRRGGVAPALAHGRARPLLHGEAPRAYRTGAHCSADGGRGMTRAETSRGSNSGLTLCSSSTRGQTRSDPGRGPALAPVPGRRHFECAPEGPVERRFRLVAHIGRDIRYAPWGRGQRLGGQTQPPAGQVHDGGNREVARETLHERGARQADVRGELGNGPRVTRAAVKQREALAHDRVSCAREPPGRLIGEARDVSPHRVHEQDFRQLGEHRRRCPRRSRRPPRRDAGSNAPATARSGRS